MTVNISLDVSVDKRVYCEGIWEKTGGHLKQEHLRNRWQDVLLNDREALLKLSVNVQIIIFFVTRLRLSVYGLVIVFESDKTELCDAPKEL
jgi:hypothetical protein